MELYYSKIPWYTCFWNFLHTVAFNIDNIPHIKLLLESLTNLIPCEKCRNKYIDFMQKNSIEEYFHRPPYGFFRWTVELHNEVNNSMHKPLMSFEEALVVWADKVVTE